PLPERQTLPVSKGNTRKKGAGRPEDPFSSPRMGRLIDDAGSGRSSRDDTVTAGAGVSPLCVRATRRGSAPLRASLAGRGVAINSGGNPHDRLSGTGNRSRHQANHGAGGLAGGTDYAAAVRPPPG